MEKNNIEKAEETAEIIERIHEDKNAIQIIKRLKFLKATKHVPKVFFNMEELHWFFQENIKIISYEDLCNILLDHLWIFNNINIKHYMKLKKNIVEILYKMFPSLLLNGYKNLEKLLFSEWISYNEEPIHILSYLRGLYCFYRKKYHLSLKFFQQALGKHQTLREKAKYLFWIGNSYFALGESKKAHRTYEEVSELYIPYYSTMSSYIINKSLYVRSVYDLNSDLENHINDWYFHTLDIIMSANENGEVKNFSKYISFVYNINVNLLFQVTNTTIALLKKMLTLKNHGYITILGDKIREKTGLILEESYIANNWKCLENYNENIKLIILALIRKESYSRYTCSLTSNKNALGIMQIRESTAKVLCERNKIIYSAARLISDNEYNVQIGTRCFEELLTIFKFSIILSIAAYNAGSPQVLKWKKTCFTEEEENNNNNSFVLYLMFIELIPISETKAYVKEVLDNLIILMQTHNLKFTLS
jgi:soluble lytic murein transglycosylase